MTSLDVHRRAQQNGVNYPMSRRRSPDLVERMVGLVLAGGVIVSLLLTVALTLGLIWLIAVIVADLARRLGL